MNKLNISSDKVTKRKYAVNKTIYERNKSETLAIRQTFIKTENLNKYMNQINYENSFIIENGLIPEDIKPSSNLNNSSKNFEKQRKFTAENYNSSQVLKDEISMII
jgi:hypothetical protein